VLREKQIPYTLRGDKPDETRLKELEEKLAEKLDAYEIMLSK